MSFFGELKRRNVVKVAVAYAIVGWLLIEVASVLGPALRLPEWTTTLVAFLLILGLPIALVLSWAYELTPEGVKPTKSSAQSEGIPQTTGHTINYVITGLLTVALAFLALDKYVLDDADPLEGLVDVSEPVPGFSDRAAIAVLPFTNLSGDPEQEYFADGVTDELITDLQTIGGFPIIAGTSTFSYKGSATDVREIAADLGAGYILEGSVRRAQDRVIITARLNNATGRQVWGDTYDRDIRDIFAVQTEITDQIIGAIQPELLLVEMERAARVRPEDMEAWDYYLQASADSATFGSYADRFGELVTLERTERALELAKKAVELDPNFADAYTLLGHINSAYSQSLRGEVSDEIADQAMRDAIEYARQGRVLSPFSATACSCYVALLAWAGLPEFLDLQTAVEIQETAVELNPANAIAHAVLGKVYQSLGRYDEALREVGLAKRLSPRDVDLSFFLTVEAATQLGLGSWEAAATVAQSATLLLPLNFDAHALRIAALYAMSDIDGATTALRSMENSIPIFSVDMLWNDPLPAPLLRSVSGLMNEQNTPTFREAVAAILEELGWSPEA